MPDFDQIVQSSNILTEEGYVSHHHFVEYAADAIDITSCCKRISKEQVRTSVSRSTAERPSFHKAVCHLAHAKISQLQIPVSTDQYVFGFEISIENIVVVQILHGQDNLSNKSSSSIFFQFFDFAEVLSKVSIGTVVQHYIQQVVGFEGLDHFNHEGMLNTLQYLYLGVGVSQLSVFKQLLFIQHLRSEILLSLLVLYEKNVCECSFPDLLDDGVVEKRPSSAAVFGGEVCLGLALVDT